jgi:hypothetical protein
LWWWELNARRAPGFESLVPFSFTEIRSWIEVSGRYVAPEEVNWLIQMDNAWMSVIAKEREAKREREQEEAERNKQKGRR